MIDIILHLLSHTFEDTWLTFPILLVTYIIIEIFERRPSSNDDRIFFLLQKLGPGSWGLVRIVATMWF